MSHNSGTNRAAWAGGGMVFAAATLLVAGIFQILMGLVALIDGPFFLVVRSRYTYQFGVYRWGWIHVAVGAAVVLTALALFTRANMVRPIGMMVAALAAISNFFFIPYYPIWTLLIIAIDVFAIWALATERMDAAQPGRRAMEAGGGRRGDQRWASTNQSAAYTMSDQGDNMSQTARPPHGDGQREQQPATGRQQPGG